MTVSAKDQIHLYKKLAELQFDSFRKCMSVIVRPKFSSEDSESSQGDTIYLFIKGRLDLSLAGNTSLDSRVALLKKMKNYNSQIW